MGDGLSGPTEMGKHWIRMRRKSIVKGGKGRELWWLEVWGMFLGKIMPIGVGRKGDAGLVGGHGR